MSGFSLFAGGVDMTVCQWQKTLRVDASTMKVRGKKADSMNGH
jgi:hypothetical protein